MAEPLETTSVKKSKAPLYTSGLIVVAVILAYIFIAPVREFLQEAWQTLSSGDEQSIERWDSQFGLVGPVVIILAMILQMFLLIIPTIAPMAVAILAYGTYRGSRIVFAAIFEASTVGNIIW